MTIDEMEVFLILSGRWKRHQNSKVWWAHGADCYAGGYTLWEAYCIETKDFETLKAIGVSWPSGLRHGPGKTE